MISGPLVAAQTAGALVGSAVFLDARAGPGATGEVRRGHVPGAFRVDLERDLSAPGDPRAGGRHPLPALEDWLRRVGSWGIDPETSVVIYDATSGAMAAARAWWMIRAVGHARVAVVDGGLPALVSAGVVLDRGASPLAHEREPYETTCNAWPSVDAGWVTRVRRDREWSLIDARAPERYHGHSEPLDPVAGHIAGANNLYWKSQLSRDGHFAPAAERRAQYDAVRGHVSPDHVVCYCGSGVTACHLILGMEAAGLHGAKLYVGSWSEWCRLHPPSQASR